MEISPAPQIGRAVKQDGAALAPHAGAEREHPIAAFAPNARIPETGHRESWRRIGNNRLRSLAPDTQAAVGNGQALHLAPGVQAIAQSCFASIAGWLDTRVNHGWLSAVENGAAAEDPIAIVAARSRRECDRFMVPVDHVRARSMGPMHRSPERAARVVLEKHVVTSVDEDWAVRVVHPVCGWEQMKLRPEGVRGHSGANTVVCIRDVRPCLPGQESGSRGGAKLSEEPAP